MKKKKLLKYWIFFVFGEYSGGIVEFTTWKHEYIYELLYLIYSKSRSDRRKSIINNLITNLFFSKRCKVNRVIDTRLSVIMSETEIRKIIRMLLKGHVSYENINNLKLAFLKNVHDSW